MKCARIASVIAITLSIFIAKSLFAYDKLEPTHIPPAGLDSTKMPQLICLGFDDNRYADGVNWVKDVLLKGRVNPSGAGNKATFDGTPYVATFYVISNAEIKDAWRGVYDYGCEIGNHTLTHEHNMSDLNYDQGYQEVGACSKYIVNSVGVPPSRIYGFRTPYLACTITNNTTFKILKDLGFLYDCTLDNGTQGTALQWATPYFPGTMEGGWIWYTALAIQGLWQTPTVIFLAPGATTPQDKGFDSGIWPKSSDLLGYLKATLDWHYNGTRSPMDIGLHSDYYSAENDGNLNFSTSYTQRQQALVKFLDYCESKPDVRIVKMVDFVRWMKNPVALDDLSKNHLYTIDKTIKSKNLLGCVNVTATGITADLQNGKLTATGIINATGKLVAERLADVVLDPNNNLKDVNGFEITYTSNVPLRMTLIQSDLEDKNASHFIGLPSQPTGGTSSAPVSSVYFNKPRYMSDAIDAIPMALEKVTSFAFSPMVLDASVSVSFEITTITFFGTDKFGTVGKKTEHGPEKKQVPVAVIRADNDVLVLDIQKQGSYSFDLYSVNGRCLNRSGHMVVTEGTHAIRMKNTLTAGIYYLKWSNVKESSINRIHIK